MKKYFNLFGILLLSVAFFTATFTSQDANAQYAYLQGGANFGQANCRGQTKLPREVDRNQKRMKGLEKRLDETEKKIGDLEDKLSELDDNVSLYEKSIRGWLKSDSQNNVAGAVVAHLKAPKVVEPVQDFCPKENEKDKEIKPADLPWASYCTGVKIPGKKDTTVKTEWAKAWVHIATINGITGSIICGDIRYIAESNQERNKYFGGPGAIGKTSSEKNERQRCAEGVDKFASAWHAQQNTLAELENERLNLEQIEKEMERLENKQDRAVEKWQDRLAEGKPCIDCITGSNAPAISSTDKALGLAAVVLGGAASYYGMKQIVNNNTEMGWPSNPMMSTAMIWPWAMAGLYGATAGFGCGGAFGGGAYGGGGGAFGYPPGMYSPYGGGMYMPGAFPAAPAMGMPGYMVAGIAGGFGGFPAAVYPAMPAMGGYPAAMPAMGGYPAMVGYPAAMPAMGGYPAMVGYPAAMPAMGGYPAMVGYPAAMPAMGGSNMAMQYQLQLQQQQQMQQMQWAAEQQRIQQDQMQRTQIISRLNMQMQQIQAQIIQISQGGYGAGYGAAGYGAGGYFGVGVGVGVGAGLYPTGTTYYPTGAAYPAGTVPSGDTTARGRNFVIPTSGY